jgi:hypothetical protein
MASRGIGAGHLRRTSLPTPIAAGVPTCASLFNRPVEFDDLLANWCQYSAAAIRSPWTVATAGCCSVALIALDEEPCPPRQPVISFPARPALNCLPQPSNTGPGQYRRLPGRRKCFHNINGLSPRGTRFAHLRCMQRFLNCMAPFNRALGAALLPARGRIPMIARISELPEVEAKCSECRLRVRVSSGEHTYSDDPELLCKHQPWQRCPSLNLPKLRQSARRS